MAKALPARTKAQLDKYKKRASAASSRARKAPMAAATKGLQLGALTAGAYGVARTQLDILDNPVAEGVTALALVGYGIASGSPTAVHAGSGMAAVAAHNAGERLGEMFFGGGE